MNGAKLKSVIRRFQRALMRSSKSISTRVGDIFISWFRHKKSRFKVLKKLQNNDIKTTITRSETCLEARMRAPWNRQSEFFQVVEFVQPQNRYLAEKSDRAPLLTGVTLVDRHPFWHCPKGISIDFRGQLRSPRRIRWILNRCSTWWFDDGWGATFKRTFVLVCVDFQEKV